MLVYSLIPSVCVGGCVIRWISCRTHNRESEGTSHNTCVIVALQEDSHKVDRQAEDEEKEKMAAAVWNFDGHPRKFREIISRRKKKKGEQRWLVYGGEVYGWQRNREPAPVRRLQGLLVHLLACVHCSVAVAVD